MDALTDVRSTIAQACAAHARKLDDVTLIAVSKQQPFDLIEAALNAGQRDFGENRVQEASSRWTPDLRQRYPDLQLHLIGHLQTNKAAEAVALFDVIHSLDSARLAKALAEEMNRQKRTLPCFIQVNTGEEPQKGGISPAELPTLITECTALGLNIVGLMCIPPVDEVPGLHFALLHKLARTHGLEQLSMGMSADYASAIAYGATHVRVGSAVFGQRPLD